MRERRTRRRESRTRRHSNPRWTCYRDRPPRSDHRAPGQELGNCRHRPAAGREILPPHGPHRSCRPGKRDHRSGRVHRAVPRDGADDLEGFKHVEKKGLALSASDRLSAGDLRLEVGGLSESVEVKADVSPVQSVSSERSAVLNSNQVVNLMSRGRDVMRSSRFCLASCKTAKAPMRSASSTLRHPYPARAGVTTA